MKDESAKAYDFARIIAAGMATIHTMNRVATAAIPPNPNNHSVLVLKDKLSGVEYLRCVVCLN